MKPKEIMLASAGMFLVLASTSYAADTPAAAMANPAPAEASNLRPAVVSDPAKVYLIRDNPFYWRHIESSVAHAREAEIAGNMGQLSGLRAHAGMSLIQAQEAQRAGNVAGMDEGIANLRKALETTPRAAAPTEGVDPQCMDELQRQCGDVEPGSGRIQKCFDDKVNNFSSMCQEKLKEGKAALSVALLENRQGNAREDAALRSSTDFVREARKNLSEAAGKKYVEIQPQKAAPLN